MYNLEAYNYDLPEELIARYPEERRDASRMMVIDRLTGETEIKGFTSIIDYLSPGDCLVVNNTRVIKARLFGLKEGAGAKIEAMLISPVDEQRKRWNCLIKPGKRVKEGTRVRLISDLESRKGHGYTDLHGLTRTYTDNAPLIANDEPRTAHGPWHTANGTRHTAHGTRPTAHGTRPTAHGERPTAHGIRHTAHGTPRTAYDASWYTITDKREDGTFEICVDSDNVDEVLETYGNIPLPPYLKREAELSDEERYQTVYSKVVGAVAAPTAGLHFTSEILQRIKEKGVNIATLTLHVGAGTFQSVSVDDIREHKMHSEEFFLSEETAELINETKKAGNKIIAVGTTTTRVLETLAQTGGLVKPGCGQTDIFLYPPYKPKVVDMLLTNFHLPKSTLLMLVSTFSSRENILNAYKKAIEAKMRFYSYGDCMLLNLT